MSRDVFVLYVFVGHGVAAAAHKGPGTKGNGRVTPTALFSQTQTVNLTKLK